MGMLKRTTEVVEHREGGDPSTSHKLPGRQKYEAISLDRLHPLDRGLLAIGSSLPVTPNGQVANEPVADWTLGRRNRALAELRILYFGPRLEGWTACSQCGEKLEFEVDCRTLAETYDESSRQPIAVHGSTFRLPTSRDLARIAGETDQQQAALLLLQNCTIDRAAS
jgi:hypothetical protein